jgi:hypothetical protein
LIPNPIHKVLSTLSSHRVQYLLMGGQACVFYGAAEFSRDCDVAILCVESNLERLKAALIDLDAENIAVPPLKADYLDRGHAIHFRCRASGVEGIRLDVMSTLRGLDAFGRLWDRRTTLEDPSGVTIELMSLSDLITAKKTQRDKDWPMLRRLVDSHYARHRDEPNEERVRFWLRESRTPQHLLDLTGRFPELASQAATDRPLLRNIVSLDSAEIERRLIREQEEQREADRRYWHPLKKELERLRQERGRET